MSSFRGITVAVIAFAGIVAARGSAGAQTCSISSIAPGRSSCSVTTSVRMSVRVPSLVGVSMTPVVDVVYAASGVVHAGLNVRANRSYALQISRAPSDSIDPAPSALPAPITWATPSQGAALSDTPTQIDEAGQRSDERGPVRVVFARAQRAEMAMSDPVRLLLTVVAP